MKQSDVRVVVVGSGPQSLTIATHLACADPTIVDDLAVVDPAGRWLDTWRRRFDDIEIPHLRSPVVHQPDPNPYALIDFAHRTQRSAELNGSYQLPGTELFADHCDEIIANHGLDRCRITGSVASVTPDGDVVLGDGNSLRARHVVLAHGTARPTRPAWLDHDHRCRHAGDVDLDAVAPGEHVVIVGGGATAAHLALGASRRGGRVTLISRRQLIEREFDTEPGWLGPLRMEPFLNLETTAERAEAAISARDGGSIPSWLLRELDAAIGAGWVRCDCDDVTAIETGDERAMVRLRAGTIAAADPCLGGNRLDVRLGD